MPVEAIERLAAEADDNGVEISLDPYPERGVNGQYLVLSPHSGQVYTLQLWRTHGGTIEVMCSCPASHFGKWCKHIALLVRDREHSRAFGYPDVWVRNNPLAVVPE